LVAVVSAGNGVAFAGSNVLVGAGVKPSGDGRFEELPAGVDTPGPVPEVDVRPGSCAALFAVAALAACGMAMTASSGTSSAIEVAMPTDRARKDVERN